MDFKKEVQDNINKIYNNEKKINSIILDLQRSNLNLIKNQREVAKVVISIDKQQQLILTQMNFIAKALDKLNKDTESIKSEQNKMLDNLQLCLSTESKSAEILKTIKGEIMEGNKKNLDEIGKVYESICTIDFHRFESNMKSVNDLAIDYLNDIRKGLNINDRKDLDSVKKMTSPIDFDNASTKLPGKDNQMIKCEHKMSTESIDSVDKDAKINNQIKSAIKKEILNQTKDPIKMDKPKLLKRQKKIKKGSRYKIVKVVPIKKAILTQPQTVKDSKDLNESANLFEISKIDATCKLNKKEIEDAKECSKDELVNKKVSVKEDECKLLKTLNASEQIKTEIKDESTRQPVIEEIKVLKENKIKSFDKKNYELNELESALEERVTNKTNAKDSDKSEDNIFIKSEDGGLLKEQSGITENSDGKADVILVKEPTNETSKESGTDQNAPILNPYLKKDLVDPAKALKEVSLSMNFSLLSSSSSSSGSSSSSEEFDGNNQPDQKPFNKPNETVSETDLEIKKSNESQTIVKGEKKEIKEDKN